MMSKDKEKYYLKIKLQTWTSNNDGIFNYKQIQTHWENDNSIKKVEVQLSNNTYLTRNENNIINCRKQNSDLKDRREDVLFKARRSFKDNSSFDIINPVSVLMKKNLNNINLLNNHLWYVIKSESGNFEEDNEDYYLIQNDIIKIGRKKYEIIILNINSNSNLITLNGITNYNISELNRNKGSVFDINIKKYQYIIEPKKIKKEKEKISLLKVSEKNEKKINSKKKKIDQSLSEIKEENEYVNKNEEDSNDNQKDINLINLENEIKKDIKEDNIINNDSDCEDEKEDEEDEDTLDRCRICLDNFSSVDNPKLCLCSCKDYVHYECLKAYLNTRVEIHENEKNTVKTYKCNKFNCEVCLMPYPLRFRIPEINRTYDLIDFNLPPELDYVVLESLDFIKEHDNLKIIHVVQLNENEFYIGRYDTNDIIDSDVSVSRNHAVLHYNRERGRLYLVNRSEKFGTLVLIKGDIRMKEKPINLQSGRTFITAKLDRETDNECFDFS